MTTFLSLYSLLSNIPFVYPIYFFYGAAFLFLGISISVKDLKASDLKLSNSLWMLGTFGFIHGFHEWLQLLPLIQGEYMTRQEIFLIKLILLATIILSFFFLLQFGLSLISAREKDYRLSPDVGKLPSAVTRATILTCCHELPFPVRLFRIPPPVKNYSQEMQIGE